MKKRMILLILLIIPLVNSLTFEQKNNLEKTLDAVDTKSDFNKLMNLLNKQSIDLSNEEKIINNINFLAIRFDIDLSNYPNVKGLAVKPDIEAPSKIETPEEKTKIKINWIQMLPVIFIIIFVLIFEVYRFKSIDEEVEEAPQETQQILLEDQLKNYVKDAEEKGYTKEEIRNILVENNWDEDMINNVLKD